MIKLVDNILHVHLLLSLLVLSHLELLFKVSSLLRQLLFVLLDHLVDSLLVLLLLLLRSLFESLFLRLIEVFQLDQIFLALSIDFLDLSVVLFAKVLKLLFKLSNLFIVLLLGIIEQLHLHRLIELALHGNL